MPQPAQPDVLAEICRHWSLTAGRAFEPGATTEWVGLVRRADGSAAVLKIARRHFEAEHEAAGLRVWDGHGAVRVFDSLSLADGIDVLLLEACEPGTPASSLPEQEQDQIVCALLRQLWIAAPADGPFRPLAGMCDAWAAGVDVARATTLLGDPGLVRAGAELFRSLAREWSGPSVLLATDLHAGNVLAADREPWLAIDPKPYVGDPTYDLTQHMLNCTERLFGDPRGFATRLASLAGLDVDRLKQWMFARCVVECDEQPHLAEIGRRFA
ncbi:MAG: streptomycin 6-kinase [Pseudonocardiales bacterium]|nr:streptomycin 6-kinase [Pseudonocardiales bacterium]